MFAGLIARVRSVWSGVRRPADIDADMTDEFRFHIELRAADLVRAGLSPADATRQARLEFGSTERYKDEGRASRGLRRFDEMRVSWLDFKLGFRMLARYPGLTLVGGLAMAFAIWVGASTFELITQVVRPTLPLDDGDRIVAIQNWDASASRPERHVLHDFVAWRRDLRSVTELGAFREFERNLITGEGVGEPVTVAEVSASAFSLTRVRPLLGRFLVAADERPDAPPVVVIGFDAWRRRFAGDPAVVGRVVRLGRGSATVVGVMPSGFGFPVAHSFWVPLRLNVLDYERREGPALSVFGRLAPGATLEEAQAELTIVGQRAAADFPDTHEHLRPRVMRYAQSIVNISGWRTAGALSINLPVVLLLMLICANVALLMFARAATRESEIIVRTALGASRRRIIMQLFAEALVLGGVSAVVGLAAAGFGLRWAMHIVETEFLSGDRMPFWFSDRLSPLTLLYAAVLTVLSAMIAGVVPALKVTRGVGARLRQAAAGAGGLRLGGLWTVVIVAQVAVTVTFPAVAFFVRRDAVQIQAVDVGFPAEQYLSVRLEMDRETAAAHADTSVAEFRARFRATYQELERRLTNEPGVAGVTFADRLPRMYHPHRLIEVDAGGAAPMNPQWPGYRVSSAAVEPDFFKEFGAPMLSGRGFRSDDYTEEQDAMSARGGAVIVNQSFVDRVLGGRNPIGRRLRYQHLEEWAAPKAPGDKPGPWYEIVGVVRDLGLAVDPDPKVAGVYHPVSPGSVYPAHIAVHVRVRTASFGPRLRAIATAVDPTLRLYDVMPLSDVNQTELEFISFWFRLLLMVSAVALVLSLAGIYSVMAFTVSRRTREIGVRVALGADRRRVIAAVFARPLTQVAIGVVAGAALTTALTTLGTDGGLSAKQGALLVAYATLMMGVCLLACIVPTRRALGVQPTEALRADG